MSSQPSEGRSLPAAGLAACVLGLVLCPFVFVANIIRRPGAMEAEFWFVTLPPLLICCGYLLYRFLGKPKERASSSPRRLIVKIIGWLMEILSWLVIVAFITVVSFYPLNTTFERILISVTFFLFASLLSLPVVLVRKTALQQRLMQLPRGVVPSVLVLVISAVVVVFFLGGLWPSPTGIPPRYR